MMIALRRLSTVPTIPDMMRAESDLWCASLPNRLWSIRQGGEARGYLALATLVLVLTRLLLWLRLIEPGFAAGSLGIATRLSSRGMRAWRQRRHDRSRRA